MITVTEGRRHCNARPAQESVHQSRVSLFENREMKIIDRLLRLFFPLNHTTGLFICIYSDLSDNCNQSTRQPFVPSTQVPSFWRFLNLHIILAKKKQKKTNFVGTKVSAAFKNCFCRRKSMFFLIRAYFLSAHRAKIYGTSVALHIRLH